MGDWGALTRIKSGALGINVLTGGCFHNGTPIPSLGMASVLGSWLRKDLAAHSIPVEALLEASLTVDFGTAEVAKQRDKSRIFADPWPPFIACTIRCRSRVATDQAVYVSEYQDYEEWPKHLAR
jgi:hypothetical protein